VTSQAWEPCRQIEQTTDVEGSRCHATLSNPKMGIAAKAMPVVADANGQHDPERNYVADKVVKAPFAYVENLPGKNIRDRLIAAFNDWLQVPTSSLNAIRNAVGILHNASLLIDDIEDTSPFRRGEPAAHTIFGTAQTINSANYMYFLALQELQNLGNPELTSIYLEELLNLHRGQGMELYWRENLICPSELEYINMVSDKTGGLFRLAVRLLIAESPWTSACRPEYLSLVDIVGIIFQILDDYRNAADEAYCSKNREFEDLSEGKFSFPIIHALATGPENGILLNMLRQKASTTQAAKMAMRQLEQSGSLSYTRRVLQKLTQEAKALIQKIEGGHGSRGTMSEIISGLEHLYSA
jgi:geranylgeranyl diphosphate synthase type 3